MMLTVESICPLSCFWTLFWWGWVLLYLAPVRFRCPSNALEKANHDETFYADFEVISKESVA